MTAQRFSMAIDAERVQWLELVERIAAVGYWWLTLDSRELRWSDQMFRIYGLDPTESPPPLDAALSAFHPDDCDEARASIERAIESGGEFSFELRLVRSDRAIRMVRSMGRCEHNSNGEPIGLFGLCNDVTDQRFMEESARQSERIASIGTLASTMAHEINNPLAYILANIDFLMKELAESGTRDQREMLVEARRGAEQVRQIIQGLKAFSRMGSDVSEAVDVTETLDFATRIVGNQLRDRSELTVDIADKLSAVDGDPSELLQVFINVLVNAAQAVPLDDGCEHSILVRAWQEGSEVVVCVRDTGVGIPEGARSRVFEPFFTTKPQGMGTGLGLSVSLGIVERMGGTIVLTPMHDRGCEATIRLPSSTVETYEAKQSRRDEAARPRVIIVDDDASVGRALGRALSQSYDVEIFVDGRSALDHLANQDADVVICDVMMPGFSGMEFFRDLGAKIPELTDRVIFITGGAFGPEAKSFVDGVQNPVLEKPLSFDELHARIEYMLSARAGRSSSTSKGARPMADT